METDFFWALIADGRRHGLTGQDRDTRLHKDLLRLSPPDVIAFQACLDHVTTEAFTWNLWAAADRIFGGWCSDDAFAAFQHWMIGLGRPVFEAALTDADVLAYAPEVLRLSGRPRAAWPPEDRPQWPTLTHLAPAAYQQLTAPFTDCGDAFYAAARALRPAPDGPQPPGGPTTGPSGRRWSALDEPESRRRLPRLTAMFPLD